jgi:ABC-2 type transport system permease protein
MKKYKLVFTTVFSNFSAYRVQVILTIIQSFFIPLFMLVALSQAQSNSVSWINLIPYYVLVSLTLPIFRSGIDTELGELTHTGDINNFLVKPLGLYPYFLFTEMSRKLITLMIVSPLLLASLIYFKFEFNFIHLVITFISAFFVSFNLNYLFGLAMFWLDEFWVIRNINEVALTLLGGVAVPYLFFPDWATNIIRFTPFPYIVSMPIRVIQQTNSNYELLFASFWIVILFLGGKYLEQKLINKYSHTS